MMAIVYALQEKTNIYAKNNAVYLKNQELDAKKNVV